MEKQTIAGRIRQEGKTFLDAIAAGSEPIYLVLLTVYVVIFAVLEIEWTERAVAVAGYIRYGLLSIVMWGSTIYLFFVIAQWKKLWKNTPALIVIGGALVAATGYFSAKMSTNSYGVVMDIFFCLMACGKDYKKILKCVMWAIVFVLVVAAVSSLIGIAEDLQKPNHPTAHSFGINYPNTWGYIVFLAMMTGWYAYLKGKRVLTFAVFWAVAVFMYFVVECRTIAALTLVFPVLSLGVEWLEKRPSRRGKGRGVVGWIITIMPLLALAFVLAVSVNFEWVLENVNIRGFETVKYRFVHNGLYLKVYGFPIFGNPYRSNVHNYINVNGQFIEPGILDSSYISYAIMRGAVWMAYTLLWLCAANYKALKKRDYAIPFLCAILLVFAMIERPGLEMWYNFILLYPLAKVTGQALTEQEAQKTGIELP